MPFDSPFVGADDSVRPVFCHSVGGDAHIALPFCSCHSEPVRTLAWESVLQRGAAALTGRRDAVPYGRFNAPAPPSLLSFRASAHTGVGIRPSTKIITTSKLVT